MFGQLQLFIVCNNLSKHSSFHAPCASVCSSATLYPCIALSIYLIQMMIEMQYSIALSISFILVASPIHSFHFDEDSISDFFSFEFQGFCVLLHHSFHLYHSRIDHFILSSSYRTIDYTSCLYFGFSNLFSSFLAIVCPLNRSSHGDTKTLTFARTQPSIMII